MGITPDAAEDFRRVWHRSRCWLGQSDLNISPAALQGLDANIQKWAGPRMARIRNPALRPFVRRSAAAAAAVAAAVTPTPSTRASPVDQTVQVLLDRPEPVQRSGVPDLRNL